MAELQRTPKQDVSFLACREKELEHGKHTALAVGPAVFRTATVSIEAN